MLCQPQDAERLRADGFTDVRPVHDELALASCASSAPAAATAPARSASRWRRCPASCSRARRAGVYIAGDTILCDDVREAIEAHRPDVVVVNAGAARFLDGDPIVMDADDVVALAGLTDARIVAMHFETVSHATETRADLRERLHAEGLTDRVAVPEDGSEVPL